MSEVKLRRGESISSALRKLKKAVDVEGVLKTVREKRFYEKPSRKRYKQRKKAKFESRLQARRDQFWLDF